jgi:hypothetical protein
MLELSLLIAAIVTLLLEAELELIRQFLTRWLEEPHLKH